ncbi:MAG: DNA recombination protein RmuC [Denitrovibrio sp.]|nr:MAG: DNA recombination protein RmuC [Denitrovibrio sp.]
MKEIFPFVTFLAGLVLGAFGVFMLSFGAKKSREKEIERLTDIMRGSFAELSSASLSKNTDEFLKLAGEVMNARTKANSAEMESKKELIDAQLVTMKGELERVHKLMTGMEKEREARFSEIAQQIKSTAYQTERLTDVAIDLNKALSSTAERGRWGERMALDIIRATGMKEKINYDLQKTMENGSRPDFTFYLPKGFCVNMDVKFPLDSYLKYCASESGEQEAHLKNFLRDVRQKIKEVTSRGYIDQQENTLDVMLLFIPNESVYEFIYEKDPGIMDAALGNSVVLTSPLSLYAVLAVIRQSVENFAFESTSGEMLKLFGKFYKQWDMFIAKLETMGKKLEEEQKAYDELTSTRRNMLERPLEKIEALRNEKGIEIDNK